MPVTQAPYDGQGNLLNYPETWKGSQMYPIVPFTGTLKLIDYEKGRSAVNMIFQDVNTGKKYPMFLSTFFDITERMTHRVINGTWTVVKRGQNYGIAPV